MFVPKFPPGFDGVGDHGAKFARAVVDSGDQVLVLTDGLSREWNGLKAHGLGPAWSIAAALRAVAAASRFEAEAYLIQYTPFAYGATSVAPHIFAIAARLKRIPVAAYFHESFYAPGSPAARHPLKARIFFVKDALLATLADKIFVAHEAGRKSIQSCVPWKRAKSIIIAPIAANVEPAQGPQRVPERASSRRLPLLAFGIVARRRRLELMLDALAVLVQRGLDVELRVLGRVNDPDYVRELESHAEALGLGQRVLWLGTRDPELVTAEMSNSRAMLFASTDGATQSSTVILVGLAHGTPIVSVATPADDPIFAGCLLSAAATPSALADAIEATLADRGAALSRSARGVALYAARFGWRNLALTIRSALHVSRNGISHSVGTGPSGNRL